VLGPQRAATGEAIDGSVNIGNPQLCLGGTCVSAPTAACGDASLSVRIQSLHPLSNGSTDPCAAPPINVDWTAVPAVSDAQPETATTPAKETFACPPNTVRVHVRDVWSSSVSPTMSTLTAPPLSVEIIDPVDNYIDYGARQDSAACSWYSVCIPSTTETIQIKPLGADACPDGNPSGTFDISALAPTSSELWLDYTGTSATILADYSAYPAANTGAGKFRITSDKTAVAGELCTTERT